MFTKYRNLIFLVLVIIGVVLYPPVTKAEQYYDMPQQVQVTGSSGYSAYEQTRVGDTIYINQYYGNNSGNPDPTF